MPVFRGFTAVVPTIGVLKHAEIRATFFCNESQPNATKPVRRVCNSSRAGPDKRRPGWAQASVPT
jgi:hypothetical protein